MTDSYRGKDGMYITHPGFGRLYHVFDEKDRSLCGKAEMWRIEPDRCVPLNGDERYRQGADCKACFRKAGLKVDT